MSVAFRRWTAGAREPASAMIHCAIFLILAAAMPVQAETTRALRGLATEIEIETSEKLRPRSDATPDAPLTLRVWQVAGGRRTRIEFIGAVAGEFDLREFLEHEDGTPPTGLAAIPVSIVSQLPPGHGTDLYSSGDSWFDWRAYYRVLLWTAVVLWLGVPVAYVVYRRLRREAPAVLAAPVAPRPTLADELRAALAAVGARALTVEERGRLELLVYRYFGERLGVARGQASEPAEMMRAIRVHPETSALAHAIERWLHALTGGEADRERAIQALENLRERGIDSTALKMPPSATAGSEA